MVAHMSRISFLPSRLYKHTPPLPTKPGTSPDVICLVHHPFFLHFLWLHTSQCKSLWQLGAHVPNDSLIAVVAFHPCCCFRVHLLLKFMTNMGMSESDIQLYPRAGQIIEISPQRHWTFTSLHTAYASPIKHAVYKMSAGRALLQPGP